jgi:hypothetical protein
MLTVVVAIIAFAEEGTMLAEDAKETVQNRLDWSTLVLTCLRDCRDEDTLIFGIQKVVEGLNEILVSDIPEFTRTVNH